MKEQPRSHELRITENGKLIDYNLIYDERFLCPCCKKESVKITHISHPGPTGAWHEDSECEDCGETFSTSY